MNSPPTPVESDDVAHPPVKTLLAALVWLTSRQRTQPDRRNVHAIVHQIRRLAVHPQASLDDLLAGLRLAASVEVEMVQWLDSSLNRANLSLH